MKKNTKDISYFVIFFLILILILIFASLLNIFFKSPEIKFEGFDFKMHNNLSFDDRFRGTNISSNLDFVIFTDFKCSACIELYPTIKKLMQNHTEINFMFKHIVQSNDPESMFSALSFECAKLQGKGYTLADYMFTNKFTKSELFEYDKSIGLNINQFVDCLNSSDIKKLVEADLNHASFLDVKGSPTIFFNGIKIEGVHSYEIYDELIKKEIKDKTK